jgi:hypothetical protein
MAEGSLPADGKTAGKLLGAGRRGAATGCALRMPRQASAGARVVNAHGQKRWQATALQIRCFGWKASWASQGAEVGRDFLGDGSRIARAAPRPAQTGGNGARDTTVTCRAGNDRERYGCDSESNDGLRIRRLRMREHAADMIQGVMRKNMENANQSATGCRCSSLSPKGPGRRKCS